MAEVSSIVLFSNDPDRTIAFYRSVGVDFEEEDHGDGLIHAATDVGDIHVAVFPGHGEAASPGWRAAGSTFVGFYVDSLEQTLGALRRLGAAFLVDHQVREWGCRVVVLDPDGRVVEINQRAHCAPGGAT
ncbi:MAG TPA: VOC family protein [Acidimicrobiales bacterium]|nr:VOC family protein [Acidimicrobiales bacterium]